MIPNITTFEQACAALGLNPEVHLPNVAMLPEKMGNALTATSKLYIVTRALNGGSDVDWNDGTSKYAIDWNYWWNEDMVMMFVLGRGEALDNQTKIPSLLCFHSYELALHACIHFRDLYNQMLNPQG